MVSRLTHVILVPYCDLILKVIFSSELNWAPLHRDDILRLLLIQIQSGLRTRRYHLGIERAPLLKAIQLPNSKAG
jgi:hypothetical protein